jgi:hypothetical protein
VLLSLEALGQSPPPERGRGDPLGEPRTTYSMAQEVRWIDGDTFAIGRWDGTLTLFGLPGETGGPRIESAAVSPAWAGLETVCPLAERTFLSSNDTKSVTIWDLDDGSLAAPRAVLPYDPAAGVANSAALAWAEGARWLVTGHANGTLLIWSADAALQDFEVIRAVDLRSRSPVPSPRPLWNIRSLTAWRDDTVVTGSEDGDLCLVRVPSGEVTCRRRYNPNAQRGVNDLALLDDLLLVGACSVGRDDSNTWLFRIDVDDGIEPLAHTDLVRDEARPQVFNFSVELIRNGPRLLFACATEEGLLWSGVVNDQGFEVLGRDCVSSGLGAAISARPQADLLAVVGDNIHLFEVRPD